MSGNIVEFPGREPPPEGYSKDHVDKLHSEAFRDMEGRLCDCVRMAQIAAERMQERHECFSRGKRAKYLLRE